MERGTSPSEVAGPPGVHRVSLVVGQLARGGLEKQMFLLATGLSRSRFQVTVVSLSRGGAWAETLMSAGVGVTQLQRHGRLSPRRPPMPGSPDSWPPCRFSSPVSGEST